MSSSSNYSSAEDDTMEGGATGNPVVKTEHLLNPPPGEAAAEVVEQAIAIQQQLTIERRRFSNIFGKIGEDCRPLVEIRNNLAKDNETYLRLASGQAKVVEEELTNFQLSLSGKNQDLLGTLRPWTPKMWRTPRRR